MVEMREHRVTSGVAGNAAFVVSMVLGYHRREGLRGSTSVRVLLYEQWFSGHHYHYLHHMLPRLIELADEVVVAVTLAGRESVEFQTLLAPFADRVVIDAGVPP